MSFTILLEETQPFKPHCPPGPEEFPGAKLGMLVQCDVCYRLWEWRHPHNNSSLPMCWVKVLRPGLPA